MTTLVARENLEGTSIKDLKVMAKENNVNGYSKMNKAELVDALYEVLNTVDEASDEIKTWTEEHKDEDHPDTFPPKIDLNEEAVDLIKDHVEASKFYEKRSTKIRALKKYGVGKIDRDMNVETVDPELVM